MVAARELSPMGPQDYFDWEAQQQLRYEYFDGQVVAMAGGTLTHGRIGLNLSTLLNAHVRGTGCITLNSDCKVGISENGPFTYPDVSVTCDEGDQTAEQFIQFPTLILEVLSASTEAYDRGGKFTLYRRLESLQEYVLVGSEVQSVEIFQRTSSDTWEFRAYVPGEIIRLNSLDLALTFEQIYDNLTVPLTIH